MVRMDFRIADTFTTSLARLTGEEQKAAKTTAFDLQLDPTGKGLGFHKLDKAKDPNFWSVRVSRDIRVIVHKTSGSLLIYYVDHHDKAYAWAEKGNQNLPPIKATSWRYSRLRTARLPPRAPRRRQCPLLLPG